MNWKTPQGLTHSLQLQLPLFEQDVNFNLPQICNITAQALLWKMKKTVQQQA